MDIWELIGGYLAISLVCCGILALLGAKEAGAAAPCMRLPPLARRRGAGNPRRLGSPVAARYINRHKLRVSARRA